MGMRGEFLIHYTCRLSTQKETKLDEKTTGRRGRPMLPESEKEEHIKFPLHMMQSQKDRFQNYAKAKGFASLAAFLREAGEFYMKKNPVK